jgi:FkbM family methyltransferase
LKQTNEAMLRGMAGLWQLVVLSGWFMLLVIAFAAADVAAVSDAGGTSLTLTSGRQGRVRGHLRAVWGSFVVVYGWRSRARLLLAKLQGRLRGPHDGAVGLRMKALNGARLYVRPGTSDMDIFVSNYLNGGHLPPPEVRARDLRQIVECASNIGTGLAGLAALYPRARLLGVEPDPQNAALARRNVSRFGERCQVVEAAVWDRETDIVLHGDVPDGYEARPAEQRDPPERRIAAITFAQLLTRHLPDGVVDYVILSAEKTEPRILGPAAEWAPRVASIRVEVYPGEEFDGPECVRMLTALGFDAWRAFEPSGECVLGVQRGLLRDS